MYLQLCVIFSNWENGMITTSILGSTESQVALLEKQHFLYKHYY